MKTIQHVDWKYTLYEQEDGSYVLELVIPARNGAWANYEKRVILPDYEKFLIKAMPSRVDRLAERLIDKERRAQMT